MSESSKRYLGDGVYVDFDGFSLVLTTEDGIRATNTIVLEPDVYAALVRYYFTLESPLTMANDGHCLGMLTVVVI